MIKLYKAGRYLPANTAREQRSLYFGILFRGVGGVCGVARAKAEFKSFVCRLATRLNDLLHFCAVKLASAVCQRRSRW